MDLQRVIFAFILFSTPPVEASLIGQWFNTGTRLMQFTFDNSQQLSEDSLYLGYLRLIDYGQLTLVYQYYNAIKLSQLAE